MGETTVLHLPFAGGLDELVSKEYLDASARQSSILNGEFAKAGSISKRSGLEYLSTDLVPGGSLPAPTEGIRVVGWSRSALSLIGSGAFYQHTPAGGGLVGAGVVPNVGVVRRPILEGGILPSASNSYSHFSPPVLCDLTYEGRRLRISVLHDPGDLYAYVFDADSGDVVRAPSLITTMDFGLIYVVSAFEINPPDGPVAVFVLHDTTDRSVKYFTYSPVTNEFSSLTTLATSVRTVDAAPYAGDPAGGWLVFYDVGGTGPTPGEVLRLAYWTLEGQQTYVDLDLDFPSSDYATGLGLYVCGRYGQSVWTVWKTTYADDVTVDRYWAQRRAGDTSLTTATAPYLFQELDDIVSSRVLTGIAQMGSDKVFVSLRVRKAGDESNWGTFLSGWHVLEQDSGTISSLAFGQIPLGLIAVAGPAYVNGEVYQPFVYNLNYEFVDTDDPAYRCKQPTLYLCKFYGVSDSMPNLGTIGPNRCLPVVTAAPRQVSVDYQVLDGEKGYHVLSSMSSRNSTRAAVGINTVGSDGTVGTAWAVDFLWGTESERALYQASELGLSLSFSAGVPFVADGQSVFEDGFFNYPEFASASTVVSISTLAEGTYTCAVVYAMTDAAGMISRSAPFILDPIDVEAGEQIKLQIPSPIGTYRDLTAASGRIYAEVYVTSPNGASLFFHGTATVSGSAIPWPTSREYTVSSPPEDGAPLLYTTGGVLDHVNPPASTAQITHQKRKALVDETRRGVWLTKQFTDGVAPGFNEALYIGFPEGEDIVALGSLDSRLIALKQNSIWYVDGQGPSPNGLGASWTDPERIPSDVGCKSWQSVVSMPNGLMFQGSDNGIYLLGRDLTVAFIGRNVVDSTNAFPNVVSATLVPSSSHVRFVCLNDSGEHLIVVFDYLLNAWMTHRYDRLSDAPAAVCMSAGPAPRYTVLSADGQLWQERLPSDAQRYLDQDDEEELHFVPTVIKLPFVKLQVQGYHRARRVQFFGERLDDCGLRVQMAFNYDDTIRQSATWAASQLNSLSVKGQVEAYVGAAFNKQMSMQLTFSDTEGSEMTTGAGMRFVSAAIELQNLGSRYKLLGAGARR